jgi:hypothetical protein
MLRNTVNKMQNQKGSPEVLKLELNTFLKIQLNKIIYLLSNIYVYKNYMKVRQHQINNGHKEILVSLSELMEMVGFLSLTKHRN